MFEHGETLWIHSKAEQAGRPRGAAAVMRYVSRELIEQNATVRDELGALNAMPILP